MARSTYIKCIHFSRLLVILLLSISTSAKAQLYQDLTSYSGIEVQNANSFDGQGISFHDFNNDGWDDLTFALAWQDPQFYLNNGDSTFTLLEPFIENNNKIRSILWVDFDNDGDSDLFATFDDDPFQLWENTGDLVFENISNSAGFLDTDIPHYAASWGDFDRDGHLDIYITSFYSQDFPFEAASLNQLYRNNGDGTFENITINANVGDGYKPTLATTIWDYNNDMWPDIYSVNDRDQGNGLYRNDSIQNFSDVSWTSNTNAAVFGMTASAADYNNDGYLDMYCTNDEDGNVLLKNNGNGAFTNTSAFSGTQVFKMSWAANWLDYDNNGYQDLYVCTQGEFELDWIGGPNLFFANNGNGTFDTIEDEIGLGTDTALSYCSAIGDIDRNGFPDIAQNNLAPFNNKVYLNSGGSNHFICVELEGVVSNKDAIGCWIKAFVDGNKYFRYTHLGENYMGQNSPRELIGIGEASVCDSLIILWPSGHRDSYYNLQGDQWLSIEEGETLTANLSSSSLTFCPGDSVLIFSGASGSHIWSDGQLSDSIYVHEGGWYSAVIENHLGLTYTSDSILIEQAPQLNLESIIHEPLCQGQMNGSVELSILPDDYSSILWSNGESGLVADSLGAGSITCDVLDNWDCHSSFSFEISQPDSLIASLQLENVSCWGEMDGSAQITPEGGIAPYHIETFGDDLDALGAGDYNIVVLDSNLCEFAVEFQIIEPDSLTVEIEIMAINQDGIGNADLSIEGGTPPYSTLWSTGDTTLFVEFFAADSYWLIVTDSQSCVNELSVEIPLYIESPEGSNLFATPNPFNDKLQLFGLKGEQIRYQFIGSTGAIWMEGVTSESQATVNTSNLPIGLWILVLQQGTRVSRQNLVKL